MSDEPDEPTPRKGRGNAILTYERVAELLTLTREVNLKLDHLVVDQTQAETKVQALELRVHALELDQARHAATQTGSLKTALWFWGAAQTAIMTVLAILSYIK